MNETEVIFQSNDLRKFGFILNKKLNGNESYVHHKDIYLTANYDAASDYYTIVQSGTVRYFGKIDTIHYAYYLFENMGLVS